MGPTASGKTALAVELVKRLPMDIINVDSAQIYRDMDIGTGKPDAATLAIAPHRLFDFLDPALSYSAAQFCQDAVSEMAQIRRAGRVPLLVGGTMLYFKALRDGLAVMPPANQQIRDEITLLAQKSGWDAVHAELADVDPASAARIHPNDPQRLQRAMEVYRLTGQTMTALHEQANRGASKENLLFLSIQPSARSVLHSKIARRFHLMLEQGFVAEVEQLYRRGDLNVAMPSIRCVGYRQIWQFLAGEIRYDEMVERGIIATRQLAKRQVTWLRSWENALNFDSERDDTMDSVLKYLQTVSM
ncbi:tRNA (adenosine(37)-N6)-dimethylallyltransferase MiaA [Pseudohongiella spirulinae]|nr:tRNA (adenosine(37)-N6)-dimethylallyltransferase MiaA [Pseudohongiella spirulinae]